MPALPLESGFPTSDIVCYLQRGYPSCVCITDNEYVRASSLLEQILPGGFSEGSKADFRVPSGGRDSPRVRTCMAGHRACAPSCRVCGPVLPLPHPMHPPDILPGRVVSSEGSISFKFGPFGPPTPHSQPVLGLTFGL